MPVTLRRIAMLTTSLAVTLCLSGAAAHAKTLGDVPAPAPHPVAVAVNVTAQPRTADIQLQALYNGYWDWRMAAVGSVSDGDGGYRGGDRFAPVDPDAQGKRIAYLRATLAALDAIAADQLSDGEGINAAVLRTILQADIANGAFQSWEMPFNSDSNFWTYLDQGSTLRSGDDYRRYIARMRDIPRHFDAHMANMRAGLKRGFSVPRVTLTGRDSSIANFITATAQENSFYGAFKQMPQSMPAAEQAALQAQGQAAITQVVIPAYRKLLDFYRTIYLPQARVSISARDLPNGPAFYAAQIREYTTLNLTAQEVHAIGLSEVARINADMHATMRASGFTGTMPQFLEFLRTDPQFYAKTPDELLSFSAYVAKRADGKIGELIGLLPRARFTIIPVPDALAPFYTAGRGGLRACQMNTYNLPSRPLYNIPALTLHECAPGHAMQAALAQERDAGPAFRRYTYFSGFGEGWGLYSEYLGREMGIYRTPYEEFGRLSYEMWRAARLVIDTGIHAQGWSRDKAIAYLADHTALSRHEVETEVDRYISWPGQALAYKLGEITIRRLRKDAEQALGERFDARKFHDVILALGSVPLPVLEAQIAKFIAAGGQISAAGGQISAAGAARATVQ